MAIQSIFNPPALSPSRHFILLLLADDINQTQDHPSVCISSTQNIRSINSHYPSIAKFISDNDTDLFAMSVVPTKASPTFKNFFIKISLNKESFYFLNIYRPPSSSTPTFFEQFQTFLEDIHHTTKNLAIIGHFNHHLETTCSNSKTFYSLIDSFDLSQKVNFPTHIHRHTLDQVLTKSNNDNISNVYYTEHFSVSFTLNFLTPRPHNNATVSFRKYHKIDKERMKADLLASELINNPSKEPDTLYKQYHITLSTLIDKHAQLHTKHTKAKYIPGWVNETVIAAKETKRLFERIWRKK